MADVTPAVAATRIGLAGIGAMGGGIARNLLGKGRALTVIGHRNRAALESLRALGAAEAADPAALARAVDVLLLCLPDSAATEAFVERARPGLRPGLIVVDMGTAALSATAALAARVGALGAAFAESPVTGGAQQAEAGALGALVGADDALFATLAPILSDFCASVVHFGPVGAAGRAKLANNYIVLGMAAVIFEAMHAADAAGVDWAKLYEVATRGAADSGVLRRVLGGAVENDFARYVFSVKGAHKDMRCIAEMTGAMGLRTPLNDAVLGFFARAEADGYGDRLISELMRPAIRGARGGV